METKAQVVLVHGAWHGSWCWEPLRGLLEQQGIKTHAPDLKSGGEQPEGLTDFYTDTEAVRRFTDSIDSPVVLAGHSYGGHVVSEASAGSANIKHLVMISTVMFEVDEVWKDIKMPAADWIKATEDGKALEIVDKSQAIGLFFNRCSPSIAAWAAGRLHTYMGTKAISQRIRRNGWKQIPSTYVLCGDDRALDIRWQRRLAERATHRVELDSDHSPFLCMPERVAEIFAEVVASL
ncbi:MAG TPA: alpha/beta hydrolase [Candidatus Binataceae bacterium]|jgi:pimeloyl-ACP methyl ester carboxylesterase|nr:alpha/beta hydrolase [Candidatus Binataceae bacterium]